MNDPLHTAILSMHPQAEVVIDIQSYRPGYLAYPARVTMRTATGPVIFCVLKANINPDRLAYEAQIIRAMADLHLPVPNVLGGPVTAMYDRQSLAVLLVGDLPGHPLPWLGLTDLSTAYRTCQLLQKGVERLHALTPHVLAHPIAKIVPSITLESELQSIISRRGAWFDVPIFAEAVMLVEAMLPRFASPLVFSNGDYNPLNFLVNDDAIVGWIDFDHACFEDPYIGFAKFLLLADDEYGWGAGAKAGLVERYMYEHQMAPAAFLVRLVLKGLQHIQATDPANPPHYMVQVITEAMSRLTRVIS